MAILAYWLAPEVDFLGGGRSVYGPGESEPHAITIKSHFTNKELLLKFSAYTLGYWLFFAVVYLLVTRGLTLSDRAIALHLGLTFGGFLLVALLNPYTTFARTQHAYLSDVYIAPKLSPEKMVEWDKSVIDLEIRYSPSVIVGKLLLGIGAIVFVINLYKSYRFRHSN
jgi:hypothetical protein